MSDRKTANVATAGIIDRVVVERVSKAYGRQRALTNVSLTLRPGRLCALLGPNGAGKSTLVGVVSTLVRPSSGGVRYTENGALKPSAVRAQIGVLAHESLVYGELSALENLSFYGTLYDVPDLAARAERVLDDMGLDRDARLRPARTYSRGMLQRLALARALLPAPRLLLLDEPFTGLDIGGAGALQKALVAARDEGKIVLVATHDLDAIGGLIDHLVVLRAGRIALDEVHETPLDRAAISERYAGALTAAKQA